MRPQRQPGAVVIGHQPIEIGHGGQRCRLVCGAGLISIRKQCACRTHGLRGLPEGRSPIAAEAVEGADGRQGIDLVAAQPGHAHQFINRPEPTRPHRRHRPLVRADVAESPLNHRRIVTAALGTGGRRGGGDSARCRWGYHARDGLPRVGAQPLHVGESHADGAIRLDVARPLRHLHIDRRKPDPAPLRVLHQRGRLIEPHRLVVEQRRVERRRIVRLEIGTGIDQQGETGRMRFGKAVQRKRRDRQHDAIGHLAGDAVACHALAQQPLHLLHALFGSLEAHRPAQFFRLPSGEPGHRHGHAQQLFLEERHTQRAPENRLEQGVVVGHRLASRPAVEIGMHHLADDGTGANEGDFHHEVVEGGWLEARQCGHLCAGFHLEDAHGIGGLQHGVDRRIIGRQVRDVDARGLVPRSVDEPDGILQCRHHAQAQQVDLDDAHVGAVFLVPLHHDTSRHAGRLEGHHRRQGPLADDHAPRVLPQVPRQIVHLRP